MPSSRRSRSPVSRRARSNAVMAIILAVAALQACSGSLPRKSASALCWYGTIASRMLREAPGTESSIEMAELPPPVMASTIDMPAS